MPFHHILVPLDLSERTDRAADLARDLAKASGARVTLFHVVETIALAGYDEFQSFYQELERRAARRLDHVAARFEDSGLHVGTNIVCGRPVDEIVRFVVSERVDLVVLMSHQVDLSRPGAGLGTLSYRLGVAAPCSVLLVK